MSKYLIQTVETYRADTEAEGEIRMGISFSGGQH